MTADLGKLPVLSYLLAYDGDGSPWVTLERCAQRDGTTRWAVRTPFGACLHKDGDFRYEPSPSGRTPEFLANSRFDTPEEAHAAWLQHFARARQTNQYDPHGIRLP